MDLWEIRPHIMACGESCVPECHNGQSIAIQASLVVNRKMEENLILQGLILINLTFPELPVTISYHHKKFVTLV